MGQYERSILLKRSCLKSFSLGEVSAWRERISLWGRHGARFPRRGRQGIAPLSLYLHHQHSQLFLDGVLPFEAENGTRERPKPLFM